MRCIASWSIAALSLCAIAAAHPQEVGGDRPTEAHAATPAASRVPPTSQEEPFTLAGPTFVAVRVADVDAAAAWYARVLVVEEVNRIDVDDGRISIRILAARGLSVELIEERGVEAPGEPRLGLFKAGLWVQDLDALHAHLLAFGVDVDLTPFTDQALNARSFVFRDLEGNRIQAFEPCDGACDRTPDF